jgi:hypothetical protein
MNKQQKAIYNERKQQNEKRFEALKDDIIKSRNFSNICRRLLKWHDDRNKKVTLTAPMVTAIKHNDMDIFLSQFTDTMMKKWNRETEVYVQIFLGDKSENGKYLGQKKLDVSSIEKTKDNPEVPKKVIEWEKAYAENYASFLKLQGIDIDSDSLEICSYFKEKQYKRQFSLTEVFGVLRKIDQTFYALRSDTNLKITPRNIKIALDVEIKDRDLKKTA